MHEKQLRYLWACLLVIGVFNVSKVNTRADGDEAASPVEAASPMAEPVKVPDGSVLVELVDGSCIAGKLELDHTAFDLPQTVEEEVELKQAGHRP